MNAYIAGPLFNPGERWFNEQIEACATRAGLKTYLPQRDGKELVSEQSVAAIFEIDVQALDRATIVIANLNGITTDDGTAWELGFAYAKGKHLVGVHMDMRTRLPHMIINLMIECSLHKLVASLDELAAYLQTYMILNNPVTSSSDISSS